MPSTRARGRVKLAQMVEPSKVSDAPVGLRQLMQTASKPRCISFTVRGSLFAFEVSEVAEIVDLKPLTRVFHAPAAIAGVENLRGEVLPVIDLSVLIGSGPSVPSADSRILVVREVAGARRRAGVLVDELGVLRELPESGLEAVPSTMPEATARLAAGIIKTAPPCCVLQVAAILACEEVSSLSADTDDERTP